MQGRWAKLPQELFIVAYVFNPAHRFKGLQESEDMVSPFALCAAVGQMFKVMFGSGLSAAELSVPSNRLYQQVKQQPLTPFCWSKLYGYSMVCHLHDCLRSDVLI